MEKQISSTHSYEGRISTKYHHMASAIALIIKYRT